MSRLSFSLLCGLGLLGVDSWAQNTFNYDGQLSGVANWSPDNDTWGMLHGRYLPELNYDWKLDTTHHWYFEGSANIFGNLYFQKGDSISDDGDIRAYRVWTRFSGKNYEARLGLQKIDFGSAAVLRPLQWFNEVDPRDPLAITDGVYALLGRYYFKNNANIWLWGLYGNEEARGLDLVGSYKYDPEFGGRFQYPTKKGELALSYHHRTADAESITGMELYEQIPEDRVALDGKWDLGIGLWFESASIMKHKDIGAFTNETLFTLGMDYTFGIGSGLNILAEHMVVGYDEDPFGFNTHSNTTALSLSYPIGFFDNLNAYATYSWEAEAASFFLNYQHDFKRISGYAMAFYTPDAPTRLGNDENNFIGSFSGPGLRLMVVYKH